MVSEPDPTVPVKWAMKQLHFIFFQFGATVDIVTTWHEDICTKCQRGILFRQN